MQQREDVGQFFEKIFDKFLPVNIVELGTGDGEFIDIIFKLMNERTNYFRIDSFDNGRLRKTSNADVVYHTMDIFANEDVIANCMLQTTLLLCDDGNKKKEIEIFAKYLLPGSVLMAHDYAHNYESFNEHKYWRTCELVYADIKEFVTGFEPFHQDLMIRAGWLSMIKTA